MPLPKLDQRFAGDDVHEEIVSQFEIIGKGIEYLGG
jgi:hypothetical protein